MFKSRVHCSLVIVLLCVLTGCGRKSAQVMEIHEAAPLSDQQISRLNAMKIFFGHQSVGANVIQGIRDIMDQDHRLKLNLVTSAEPQSVSGPAFVESLIGKNGNPRSKDKAFADILARGMGSQGGIALYKYCYVDIDPDTDVQQLFKNYSTEIADLTVRYPALTIVPVTVPLTTDEAGLRTWVKTMIGRPTSRDVNLKRNQFNALLRKNYAGKPFFDLAQIESTRPDGSRSYVVSHGQTIYTLAPELTTDGGHLNQTGRQAAARQLLEVLAGLP